MNSSQLIQQDKLLEDPQILLSYTGNISDNLFGCLLELSENKLGKFEEKLSIRRKVYHTIIEVIQNIYHHFEKFVINNDIYNEIVFVLKKNKKTYSIYSGNHIYTRSVPYLKSRIDQINGMTREELKENYRKKLSEGMISPEGEGGLGILDIGRKSKCKLKYDFKKIDKDISFFSLEVKISA